MSDIPCLRLSNLMHTYTANGLAPRTVLNVPTWQVAHGEHLLLRGISGSGKTTLLNLLSGLLTPTQGSVEVLGQALSKLTEADRDRFRAQHVGYVFQTHNLLPFSALENVAMPLAFLGVPPRHYRPRAAESLAQVGLAEWQHHKPHQLSAGQRLRVAVARALIAKPALLLADEPTAALDPETGAQVMDLIQRVCHAHKATLIVASHDPALSERFAQVAELRGGTLQMASAEKVGLL